MTTGTSRTSISVGEGLTASNPVRVFAAVQPYPDLPGRHIHPTFEIGVLLSGQTDRYLEDLMIRLEAGDVYLSPACEPHGWRAVAPGTILLVVYFLPQFLGEETFEGSLWLSLFARPASDRPRVTGPEMRERVLEIAHGLDQESRHQQPGWRTSVRLGILQLLFTISRGWHPASQEERQRAAHSSDLVRVMPAIRLMQSSPGRRIGLAEASAACSLSPSRFSLIFRRAMGGSFGRFALRSRVGSAAELLLTSDLSVAALAGKFGFADASHFHRAFVKLYERTPADYRREGQ